ncbi:TPA: hypothetical protein ACHVGM_002023, partial [Streptococcus suis]
MKNRNNDIHIKKTIPSVLLHLLASLLVILLTVVITLTSQLLLKNDQAKNNITRLSNGYYSYTIIDTLYEDDAFYQFRSDKESLDTLRIFYNNLYQSKEIELLATFNQPLFIQSFNKGEKFLYDEGMLETNGNTKDPEAVKSFQMNRKAFDFYHLKVEEGEEIDWPSISLLDFNSYPILLGSQFREHYKLGDKITGEFYTKTITFEVKGFLEPNSYVFYKGNAEFYLDDYIVIPYPIELPDIKTKDFTFEGILYFAMINSQFATRLPREKVLEVLREQSEKSGFVDFSLLEVDDFLIKYEQLLSVISRLQILLIILVVALGILFLYV